MSGRFEKKSKSALDASAESIKKYKYGEVFLSAIRQGRRLSIKYETKSGAISKRTVELIKLFNFNDRIYFKAYCHLREENRSFRLGRVGFATLLGKNSVVTNASYNPPSQARTVVRARPRPKPAPRRASPGHPVSNKTLHLKKKDSSDSSGKGSGFLWGIGMLLLAVFLSRGCS